MRTKKDFDRQNEYNKEQYDRISLMLPKGMKPLLQGIAKREKTSVNDIIKRSIQNYIATSWNVHPQAESDRLSAEKLDEPSALDELQAKNKQSQDT